MSKISADSAGRRRRADAERSVAAILEAAARVLAERPDASMEEVAATAGVTRQTVYAHFRSREALVAAIADRATSEAAAALEAARLDEGPPVEALGRMLDLSWEIVDRYPVLAHLQATPAEDRDRHEPVLAAMEALVRRGQASGDFDDQVPASWLLAAVVGLGHAAGAEVATGRMTSQEAVGQLRQTVMRVFGVEGALTSSP